ncbi:hypothetical protein [Clavibacter tessellarius]|uniref:hypothetical protein n=1 Tax=Clavibacter tessellarius TaxID=31965 RepID=UPI00324E1B2E
MRTFVLSRGVSWAGNALTAVALPVLVYTTTGDAALLGLVAMMEALPYLVLALPVGALVDGWDARRTMLATTWLSAAATATVPLAALGGTPHPRSSSASRRSSRRCSSSSTPRASPPSPRWRAATASAPRPPA